ncbi:MAG: tetratricopeptide repeat protein [Planctomycetota bacterium]
MTLACNWMTAQRMLAGAGLAVAIGVGALAPSTVGAQQPAVAPQVHPLPRAATPTRTPPAMAGSKDTRYDASRYGEPSSQSRRPGMTRPRVAAAPSPPVRVEPKPKRRSFFSRFIPRFARQGEAEADKSPARAVAAQPPAGGVIRAGGAMGDGQVGRGRPGQGVRPVDFRQARGRSGLGGVPTRRSGRPARSGGLFDFGGKPSGTPANTSRTPVSKPAPKRASPTGTPKAFKPVEPAQKTPAPLPPEQAPSAALPPGGAPSAPSIDPPAGGQGSGLAYVMDQPERRAASGPKLPRPQLIPDMLQWPEREAPVAKSGGTTRAKLRPLDKPAAAPPLDAAPGLAADGPAMLSNPVTDGAGGEQELGQELGIDAPVVAGDAGLAMPGPGEDLPAVVMPAAPVFVSDSTPAPAAAVEESLAVAPSPSGANANPLGDASMSEAAPLAPMPAVSAPQPSAGQQGVDQQIASARAAGPRMAGSRYPRTQPRPLAVSNAARKAMPNPVPVEAADAAPSPRAVALLAEANKLAQTAQSEQELTYIVRRCRHTLAIDRSTDVVAYSRQLAGWALNKRGELRADEARDGEAMTDFQDALRLDKNCWRALHNRGVMLAQRGDFAGAFDAFNETILQNPEFAKAYSNRASLYVQAGEFAAAMADYQRAIDADPDLAIAHKGRGRVCHMLGRIDEAIQHFDAAVLLEPEDASTVTCRADLLVDMGRYAAAQQAYRQAAALDPELPDAPRNLAWLQATCPDARFVNPEEAVANAERAIELLGGDADDVSLDTLAAALACRGDYTAAVGAMKRAIQAAGPGDQPSYGERLSAYEAGRRFVSSPVAAVHQVGYEQSAW